MNIFALSECPVESAQQVVDKHVVKMPTESCQMLHTNMLHFMFLEEFRREPTLRELKAFYNENSDLHFLMKPAMLNHPSTIWARQSLPNMNWLLRHSLALCEEYTYRYRKVHGSQRRIQEAVEWSYFCNAELFPSMHFTPPTIAMFDAYRLDRSNYFVENPRASEWDFVIASYRNYYIKAKYKFATWKGREAPSWYDFSYGQEKQLKLANDLRELFTRYANKHGGNN